MFGCDVTPEPDWKFKVGDRVKHVLSDDIGIVTKAYYWNHDDPYDRFNGGVAYYDIKFATTYVVGNDSAAGSGFGHIEHFSPSKFTIERCEDWELTKVDE